jgi:NAD(P)-dependent dehydrogenase (short-subunit alcohol dehydrogenase family)
MANTSKTVIVSGGSQGIGSGAVQAFLDRGYNVVATSRNVTKSKDLPSKTPSTARSQARLTTSFGICDRLFSYCSLHAPLSAHFFAAVDIMQPHVIDIDERTNPRLSLSYFSGRVATALGRASRRWLHDATAGGGPISISGRKSRNGM